MKSINHKLLAWLVILALGGVVWLYVKELKIFGNTIGGGSLAVWSAGIGALAGLAVGWYFYKKNKREEFTVKMQIWTSCLFLPVLIAPLLGSLSNRLLSPHALVEREVEFMEEKPFAAERFGVLKGEEITPDGYYLFVWSDGEMVRFENKTPIFPEAKRGDLVLIPLQEGLWGYYFLMKK